MLGQHMRTNDLRAALGAMVEGGVVHCVDLGYGSVARKDPNFVTENVDEIRSYLDAASAKGTPYDVLLFGLADIPSHQRVAEDVREALEGYEKEVVKSTVWIAFDSPTVLSPDFVKNGDYAIATFSNSTKSNSDVVRALFRRGDISGAGKDPGEDSTVCRPRRTTCREV